MADTPQPQSERICGNVERHRRPTKAHWLVHWPSGRWRDNTACAGCVLQLLVDTADETEQVLLTALPRAERRG